MRKSMFLLMSTATFLIMSLTSCEHRPLVDINELHYVRIYLDERLRNVNFGFYDETKDKPEYKTPQIMRVALFDPTDEHLVSERYLRETGSDEKGYYIHGYVSAPPGTYNLVAYNFDTQKLEVKNDKWLSLMEAYTKPIDEQVRDKLVSVRSSKNENTNEEIINEPEHFFVNSSPSVKIELTGETDTLKNADGSDFVAKPIVKTYYM